MNQTRLTLLQTYCLGIVLLVMLLLSLAGLGIHGAANQNRTTIDRMVRLDARKVSLANQDHRAAECGGA